jgi:uncharacterized protein
VQFELDNGQAAYRIGGYRQGEGVIVNARLYNASILLLPEHLEDWPPQSMAELRAGHFQRLLELRPGCVIFGSGQRFQFPEPALLAPLTNAGIGVEVMDTAAACRTYTLLMAEGRKVAAALLIHS